MPRSDLASRVASIDWSRIEADLDAQGFAVLPRLLDDAACRALSKSYTETAPFRSRVVMARHGFGRGEYKYFAYPLPATIGVLRTSLYPWLAGVANRWNESMGLDVRYPDELDVFLARCHAAGQSCPTPLLLRYGPDDYNCLHQDLYGEHVFPLQAVFLLSSPGEDFEGGELALVEQRPRMQSRVSVVRFGKGEGVVFAVNHRPVRGTRGWYRVAMRHGVSRLASGERYTAGVIFHDAT